MFILEDIKNYLNGRARAEQILKLTDKELEKYVNLALTILETYYKIDELLVPETRNTIIAEETLFVFKNNTDFEKFYEYEGLSQFNIAGAIAGTVTDDEGKLIPSFVKALLYAAGIDKVQEDIDSDLFTTFDVTSLSLSSTLAPFKYFCLSYPKLL